MGRRRFLARRTKKATKKKSATPHEQLRDVYKIFYTLQRRAPGEEKREGKKLKIYGFAGGNFRGVEEKTSRRKSACLPSWNNPIFIFLLKEEDSRSRKQRSEF